MTFQEEFELKTGKKFKDFHKINRKKHVYILWNNWSIQTCDGYNIVDRAFEQLINKFDRYDISKGSIDTYFSAFVRYCALSYINLDEKIYDYDEIINYVEEDDVQKNYSKINIVYEIILGYDNPMIRNMLIMRYRYGWKYEKIATICKLNHSTVRGIFYRYNKDIYKKYNTKIRQN